VPLFTAPKLAKLHSLCRSSGPADERCRLVSRLYQFSAFDSPAMDNQFTAPNDSAIDYQLRLRRRLIAGADPRSLADILNIVGKKIILAAAALFLTGSAICGADNSVPAQQLGRHWSVSLNYYPFYRGGFVTSQTRIKDVDDFSIWISYTF
jgi:hypothetical protein